MIPLKMLSFGTTKKMVLILQKVDTIGFSKLPIQLVKICLHTPGLGFGNFSFLKITNSFFDWLVIMLSQFIFAESQEHSSFCYLLSLWRHDETFLHCVRDCTFSVRLWHHLGFTNADFFSLLLMLMIGLEGELRVLRLSFFSVGVWCSWRHRNLMCMGGKTWSLKRLSSNIKNSIESILVNFPSSATAATTNRYTRWNNNNISGAILNVDGCCHGTPTRTGFGGILRNDSGLFIAGCSGFISDSNNILLAELSAIYHGITMAKDLGYAEFACYSDSLVCINLINGPIERYHIYVVLIQDIKHLLHQINVTVSHTLREGNQCADFMAKLGVTP